MADQNETVKIPVNGTNVIADVSSTFPSVSLSGNPTSAPTKTKSNDPTETFSIAPTESVLPSVLPSSGPTKFPTIIPSVIPTEEPKPSLEPTSFPTGAPIITQAPTVPKLLPQTCRRLKQDFIYYCPYQRYCEWDYYDFTERNFLRSNIGYERLGWNYVTPSIIDATAFSELSEKTQNGLVTFGDYDEDKHDCCNGHYGAYDWSDFDPNDGYGDILNALLTLGYTELSWQNDIPGPYDDYYFRNLPKDQQVAAELLCYTSETWDGLSLNLWPNDIKLPGSYNKMFSSAPTPAPTTLVTVMPTQEPCRELDPSINYFCPAVRYCEWDFFIMQKEQVLRFQLGYTEQTWNYETELRNPLEFQAFTELEDYVQRGLNNIGFDEERHDCCLAHYYSYDWSDFALYGMTNTLAAYEALGYNEERWNNDEPSKYDLYDWVELPMDIKKILIEDLCYNKELWDMTPLTEWPENIIFPGSNDTLGLITSGSVGMKTFSLLPLLCMGITILQLIF